MLAHLPPPSLPPPPGSRDDPLFVVCKVVVVVADEFRWRVWRGSCSILIFHYEGECAILNFEQVVDLGLERSVWATEASGLLASGWICSKKQKYCNMNAAPY